VIVHVPNIFTNLKSENWWPVCYVPLPYAVSPITRQGASETVKPKTNQPPYTLIAFGYMGSNRRIDAVLQALNRFPDREKFRLSIYGKLDNEGHIRSLVSSLGLINIVRIHGFVPEKELELALSQAHLAVNLRYPTMGEASGSQLRIWYHNLPSLVSNVGWYADIPEDATAFVRPEREIEDICKHLGAFIENPEGYAKMGKAGRRILDEHHDPVKYAQAIIAFAKRVSCCHLPATADYLTARCVAELMIWSKTSVLENAMGKAAREILELCQGGNRASEHLLGDGVPSEGKLPGAAWTH
jgi:glycosyltransferase involved in cell wall biosynthesis